VLQVLPQPNMQRKKKPLNIEYVAAISQPPLTADARSARSRIAFTYPRSDRIDPANSVFLVVSQKRTGCRAIFGRFDVAGGSIQDKTVYFHKIRQADIKIIRSRCRIQFRPWDSNLFTAFSTSFAVEVQWHHLREPEPSGV
jgi:hypothetical protein